MKKSNLKIKYDPAMSVEENALKCGCSVANVRKYIATRGIDRRFDSALNMWRKVNEYCDQHETESITQAAKALGISPNTLKKYCAAAKPSQTDKTKVSKFDLTKYSNVITTVGTNDECLHGIVKLYVPNGVVDVDLTYSVGGIWNSSGLEHPRLKFDKFPQTPDTLPLDDIEKHIKPNSIGSVLFDLPFLFGKSSKKSLMMVERYNKFDTLDELIDTNISILELSHRLLGKGGVLIVKTMDIKSEGKQVWVRDLLCERAKELEFSKLDEFIYTNQSRLGLSKDSKKQHTARKAHGYYLVFRKKAVALRVDCCRIVYNDVNKVA